MPAFRSKVMTQSQRRWRSLRPSSFSAETAVYSTGSLPFPAPTWCPTVPCMASCKRAKRSVCPRSAGCFSPSFTGGIALRHRGSGFAVKSRSYKESKPNAWNVPSLGFSRSSSLTCDSNASKATATWAAVSGAGPFFRAQLSLGMLTPPGRLRDSSIH